MTTTVPGAQPVAREPTFGTRIPYRRHIQISLTDLYATLRAVAPSATLGDWKGPFTALPENELDPQMLSIDGVPLVLMNGAVPLPPAILDPGYLPNAMYPDAANRLRDHQAHAVVLPARRAADRPEWVATARAVTLLTWAIAKVTQAEAFKWEDANNFATVSALEACGPQLLAADGMAIPIWVRILCGRAHGQQKLIAGSYGLWAFGLPEIEFAPTDYPLDYLITRAYAVSWYLLTSNVSVKDGDTIRASDGSDSFRAERLEHGFFGPAVALRLSILSASGQQTADLPAKAPDPGRWSRLTSWMGRR